MITAKMARKRLGDDRGILMDELYNTYLPRIETAIRVASTYTDSVPVAIPELSFPISKENPLIRKILAELHSAGYEADCTVIYRQTPGTFYDGHAIGLPVINVSWKTPETYESSTEYWRKQAEGKF